MHKVFLNKGFYFIYFLIFTGLNVIESYESPLKNTKNIPIIFDSETLGKQII